MSRLELQEFHSFLEELIEASSAGERFSIENTIASVLKHPKNLAKIQSELIDLGLRALIRNNCRAKKSTMNSGPDMFGHYHIGKRVSVPYHDSKGKLRWDKKRRDALSFDDLDEILKRGDERPTRQSREREEFAEIDRITKQYRNQANSVAEALEMAERDGR